MSQTTLTITQLFVANLQHILSDNIRLTWHVEHTDKDPVIEVSDDELSVGETGNEYIAWPSHMDNSDVGRYGIAAWAKPEETPTDLIPGDGRWTLVRRDDRRTRPVEEAAFVTLKEVIEAFKDRAMPDE